MKEGDVYNAHCLTIVVVGGRRHHPFVSSKCFSLLSLSVNRYIHILLTFSHRCCSCSCGDSTPAPFAPSLAVFVLLIIGFLGRKYEYVYLIELKRMNRRCKRVQHSFIIYARKGGFVGQHYSRGGCDRLPYIADARVRYVKVTKEIIILCEE